MSTKQYCRAPAVGRVTLAEAVKVRRALAKVLRGIPSRLTQDAARHFAWYAAPALIAWPPADRCLPLEQARRRQADFPDAGLSLAQGSDTTSGIDHPNPRSAFIQLAASAALTAPLPLTQFRTT